MLINEENKKSIINAKLNKTKKSGEIISRKEKQKKQALKAAYKDIKENHDWSWYEELRDRNKNNLNKTALFYRGQKISYQEMFSKMETYAKSLKTMGIKQGDEIPACMTNSPEVVYLLGAASMLGAKLNIFGFGFSQDYIKEIIDDCNSNVIFVTDDLYPEVSNTIEKTHISNIVIPSLTDSLPNNKDPYYEIDKDYYDFKNRVPEYQKENNKILSNKEFMALGKNYNGSILAKSSLNDEFTTTYSSGSTNSSTPKAIVHCIRSFIVMGSFHDPELSHAPSMSNLSVLAQIPTHSNTDIISSISDTLIQGATVDLEPIYDKDFFINSLLINKSNFVVATRSFWINTIKKVLYNPKYKNVKFSNLLIPMSVGEPLELGEEKFINNGLRKAKTGTKKIPVPISPITISVAGGDCEHGGIFFVLFSALQNKKPSQLKKKTYHGLTTYDMVDIQVLNEKNEYCKPNEIGRIVANSPCNMKCYKNNEEATKEFFIKDSNGKTWGNCNTYGYKDEHGYLYVKGRMSQDDLSIPAFMVADTVLRDTKNILSCEVVNENGVYIVHIEFQPEKKKSFAKTIAMANKRCQNKFGNEFTQNVVYRYHDNIESFPLTGCGKRNNLQLKAEGLSDKCLKVVEEGNDIKFVNAINYLNPSYQKIKK